MIRPFAGPWLLSVLCALIGAGQASAQNRPEIHPPALAIVNRPGSVSFIPVTIAGRNFGEAISTSKVNVFDTVSEASDSYAATDSEIELWQDDKIILKLPTTFGHPRVEVEVAGSLKSLAFEADRYDYNYFTTELYDDGLDSKPLAIAIRGSYLYVLEEFSRKFKRVNLADGAVSDVSEDYDDDVVGIGDCFAYPFFNPSNTDSDNNSVPDDPNQNALPDDAVNWSSLNESIIVDETGLLWFSQGGAGFFNGLAGNHSRILSVDPEATGSPYRVYNIPGDNNQVGGLAWDSHRKRIWFANAPRWVGGFCRSILLPARLTSFRPVDGDSGTTDIDPAVYAGTFRYDTAKSSLTCSGSIGWVAPSGGAPGYTTGTPGTCSNDTSRDCYTADDCVLVEHICTSEEDDSCFQEYPLALESVTDIHGCVNHVGAGTIGHLVVSSVDHAVWFTNFVAGELVDPADREQGYTMFLGRFDPDASSEERERHYPIRFVPYPEALNGPWEIEEAVNGDLVFTLDGDNSIARFKTTRADDPVCLTLVSATTDCETDPDETCRNPCLEFDTPTGFGDQGMHSLAEDKAGNFWVSQYAFEIDPEISSTVGYWKADRSGFAMFPSPSFFNDSNDSCPDPFRPPYPFTKFLGAGIAVDKASGDVWFADYCRERVGRLRKSSVCD